MFVQVQILKQDNGISMFSLFMLLTSAWLYTANVGTFVIGYSSLCKILNADDYSGYFMLLKSCILLKMCMSLYSQWGGEGGRGGGAGITESDRIFKCRDRYRLNQII